MRFIIKGGKPLSGEVTPSGSKNAALPIIAATLLTSEECTLTNIPDIQDVRSLLEIMQHIGSRWSFSDNTLRIQTAEIRNTDLPYDLVKKMRASMLLVGPLLARAKKVRLGYPGGCVLGKRPIDTHLDAFSALGVNITEEGSEMILDASKAKPGKVVLKEISVTATENLLMFASSLPGQTIIRLAAQEPHVVDLCRFLIQSGTFLQGEGTHVVSVEGGSPTHGVKHRITSDYLEIGTLAIAAAGTRGDIIIRDAHIHDLDALWQKLEESGVPVDLFGDCVHIRPAEKLKAVAKLDTGIFPKFPSDLQAPFMVLMTQAHGVSKVFETLFEGRLNYLFELEKMGARFEFLNPHQAIVIGPTPLFGTTIASCDIRAGAGMIVAALMAEGTTEVTNISYIDRGYEALDDKLRSLGANIVRSQSEEDILHPEQSVMPFHSLQKRKVGEDNLKNVQPIR